MVLFIRFFSIVFAGLFLVSQADAQKLAWAGVSKELLQEARKLADRDKIYFDKRMAQEWKALYEFQHPTYRKNVSYEEYMYHEGQAKYSDDKNPGNHVSGNLTTRSPALIKKDPRPRDSLGFPRVSHYRWYLTSFVTVTSYQLDKVSISKDGKYAMVSSKLKGREKLNPALFRALIEFDVVRPYIDYWEKVDGKWVITLLAHPAPISGARMWHYIPNNHDGWKKMQFDSVDAKEIYPQVAN